MDEILEDMATPSYYDEWKIYILDECHMMSNAAQNRLLKTLEEPSEKVLIILCTTDPEKLLGTIISRCQYTFKVQKPKRTELCSLLAKVCNNEGVKYEPRALSLVCVKGEFVPRKTLIALEQVVRETGNVTYANVIETLNVVADLYFFEFYRFLTRKQIDVLSYVTFIGRLKEEMDLSSFIDNLIGFTKRGIYVINGVPVEALDTSEIAQYKDLFRQFGMLELTTILTKLIAMQNSKDIEMMLLHLGYTGIRQHKMVEVGDLRESEFLTMKDNDVSLERQTGENNFMESITVTCEEKEELVNEHKKEMDSSELASLFPGGTMIHL